MALLALVVLSSCEKNEPLTDLESRSGDFIPLVRTGLSNRNPLVGDTVIFTTTTWQKNDEIRVVHALHTLYEDFGLIFQTPNHEIITNETGNIRLVVTDTMVSKAPFFTTSAGVNSNIEEDKTKLDLFFNTVQNAYVVPAQYTRFKAAETNYPLEGDGLLDALKEGDFRTLVSLLAAVVGVTDYTRYFPDAPNAHFTMSGANRTGVSAVGRAYMRENLTKEILKTKGYKMIRKQGRLGAILTASVVNISGAKAEFSNTIQANY